MPDVVSNERGSDGARYVYGFAVGHVQQYVLAGSRLREIQGASHLLEQLCGETFTRAVAAAGLDPDACITSQAAAGARLQSDDGEAVARLHAAWPRIAHDQVPGALIQQAVVKLTEGMSVAAAHRLLGERLRGTRADAMVPLPGAGPLVYRYPRSGLPGEFAHGKPKETVDLETHKKVEAWRSLRPKNSREQASALDLKLLGPLDGQYVFAAGREGKPEGLYSEACPYVGVIHADGNRVGKFIENLFGDQAKGKKRDFKAFSRALAEATELAVQRAVAEELVEPVKAALARPDGRIPPLDKPNRPILPARPIVLGGDDLTIIVSAERALAFTRAFLEAFEQTTKEKLGQALGAPGLSACAGVAFTKATFPFDRAYTLAESLCHQAKARARSGGPMPSAIAFHRVTTALPGDAAEVLERELSSAGRRLTFGAYRVGQHTAGSLASLADLMTLARALQRLPRGGRREVLGTLRDAPDRARDVWERTLEVTTGRMETKAARAFKDRINRAATALTTQTDDPIWRPGATANHPEETALLDAAVVARFALGRPEEVRS